MRKTEILMSNLVYLGVSVVELINFISKQQQIACNHSSDIEFRDFTKKVLQNHIRF